MTEEIDINQLKARLNELLVKYCRDAQHVLPNIFKLSNTRGEIEMVMSKLKKAGHPVANIDDVAKQLGIDLESIQKTKQVING